MGGLVLLGCSNLPPLTAITVDSTVDPIAHAQFLYKNYSQTTNLWVDPFGLCTDGLVVKNYPSHREYSKSFAIRNKLASLGKDDPYSLGNNPNFEEKFLTDQFDVICSNDGGYFIDGWCVDKSNKDRALFWAKIKPTGKDFNGVVRPAIRCYCSSSKQNSQWPGLDQLHRVVGVPYGFWEKAPDRTDAEKRKHRSNGLQKSCNRCTSLTEIPGQGIHRRLSKRSHQSKNLRKGQPPRFFWSYCNQLPCRLL